jgi:hypothetical protein
MLPDNFIKAIKLIASKLKDRNIKWALVGTANLTLQGLDVKPNDLDIVTLSNHIKIFEYLFKDYIIKPLFKKRSSTESCPDYYVLLLDIEGVEVEIMGETEESLYFTKSGRGEITNIDLEDIQVSCLDLTSEAKAYELLGRKDKAEMIREFIKP